MKQILTLSPLLIIIHYHQFLGYLSRDILCMYNYPSFYATYTGLYLSKFTVINKMLQNI